MRKTLFAVCLLAFSLLAQTKPEKDHTKYFPITVGNKWEYEWEKNGQVVMSTFYTVKKHTKDGYIFTKLASIMGMSPVYVEEGYTVRDKMLLKTGFGGGLFFTPFKLYISCPMLLKFPIVVGDTWEYQEDGGQKITRKVLNWHDTLITKYGVYRDVYEISEKIIDGSLTLYNFEYYAYGIGKVLDENSDFEYSTRSITNVLKSYTILE